MSALEITPMDDTKVYHTLTTCDMTTLGQSCSMQTPPQQTLAPTCNQPCDMSNRTTLQEVLSALSVLADSHPDLYSHIEDTLTKEQVENQSTAPQPSGVHMPVYDSLYWASETESSLEQVNSQQPYIYPQTSMCQSETWVEAKPEQYNKYLYHQQIHGQQHLHNEIHATSQVGHSAARNLMESFMPDLQCPYCHTMFQDEGLLQGHKEFCEQSMLYYNTNNVNTSGYFDDGGLASRLGSEELRGNTSPSYSISSASNLSTDSPTSEVKAFELPPRRRGRPRKVTNTRSYSTSSSDSSDVSTSGYSSRCTSASLSKSTNGLFVCGLCDAKFTFHTNLTRHQRKLHGKPCTRGRGAHRS